MLQPIPYLSYNGNCEEAMQFYEKVLAGQLAPMVRFSDMPCPSGAPALDPARARLVAHARLMLEGGGMLFAGDCPPGMPYEGVKGVSMTISYDTVEQAQKVFAALSEGGKVTMPMGDMFWAQAAGMCLDKFGVSWSVNGALKPVV